MIIQALDKVPFFTLLMLIGFLAALTILLLSISRWLYMAFPRRRFDGYKPMFPTSFTNTRMIEDEDITRLVNNTNACAAHARHVIGGKTGEGPGDGQTEDLTFTVTATTPRSILDLPLRHLVTGASNNLRIWVRGSRADNTKTAKIVAQVGTSRDTTHFTAANDVLEWLLLEVTLPSIENTILEYNGVLSLSCAVDADESGSESIAIRAISIFEPPGRFNFDWIDTTGANCKIGQPDYPVSTAMMRILTQKSNAIRSYRMPRCNVFQTCYMINDYGIGGAYGGDENTFGEWVIRCCEGVTQLDCMYYAFGSTNNDDIDTKISLYSMDSIDYDNQTTNFTVGSRVYGATSGASATIVKDTDAGATGTLCLSYVNGTFQDNETIHDTDGGEALVNGAHQGPDAVVNCEQTDPFLANVGWRTNSINAVPSVDAEYLLRIDFKDGGSTETDVKFNNLQVVEALGTAVTHVKPNSAHTQEDDDGLAKTFLNIKNTQDNIWTRQRQIVLHDQRWSDGGPLTSKGVGTFNVDAGQWGAGPVFATEGAEYIKAIVWFRKNNLRYVRMIDYDNKVAGMVVGDTATGATNGATATLEAIGGAAGTLILSGVDGFFQDNEVINFSTGGSVDADGVLYEYDSDTIDEQLRFWTTWPNANAAALIVDTATVDVSDFERNKQHRVEMKIPIPRDMAADYTIHSVGIFNWTYLWWLDAATTDEGAYIIIDKYVIVEEPSSSGGWVSSDEDAT
jgi:hypothetical protein